VSAGAQDIHLHPKNADGVDTLEPPVVAAAIAAVRATLPTSVQVGVTTGSWAEPDPERRAAMIRSWPVLPDHASVNWHEDGAEKVAHALLARGVGIEAGLYSGTDAVRRFRTSALNGKVLRVLAEVTDADVQSAIVTARSLVEDIRSVWAGRILLHGEGAGVWPVLKLATEFGFDARIGLEDALLLPDGSAPAGNADLVRAAIKLISETEPS